MERQKLFIEMLKLERKRCYLLQLKTGGQQLLKVFKNNGHQFTMFKRLKEVYYFKYLTNLFKKWLGKFRNLNVFFRIIPENYLGSLQRRLILNNSLDAEQRYLNFLKHYPKIAKKVPNYLIASYLGITPEFLSRIRKKMEAS